MGCLMNICIKSDKENRGESISDYKKMEDENY